MRPGGLSYQLGGGLYKGSCHQAERKNSKQGASLLFDVVGAATSG